MLILWFVCGCRAPDPEAPKPPAPERGIPGDSSAHSNDAAVVAATNKGRVVSVRVKDTDEIYWDGEAVDANTLRTHLSTLQREDTVAWYGDDPSVEINATQRSVLESLLKLGVRLVWVQPSPEAAMSGGEAPGRSFTVNTRHIREALRIYDELKGRPETAGSLLGADMVLRFEPDTQTGYRLQRVELGLAGSSFWVVHESLNEAESATSIQFKKEW